MAKKHHMTKHQYNVYQKNNRSYYLDREGENDRGEHFGYGKIRRKSEKHLKQQLRYIQGQSGLFLSEEDEEDELSDFE